MHKPTPPDHQPLSPAELLDALIEAAYQNDQLALARLCEQHSDEIVRSFPSWRSPSDQHRTDEASIERYGNGLVAIARYFDGVGDSRLIQVFRGSAAENPLVQWDNEIEHAKSLLDSGHNAEALTLLHTVLERTRPLIGPGATLNRLFMFGFLAEAYIRTGDDAKAIAFTEQALEMCQRLGDEAKARICKEQIASLKNKRPSD